MRYFLCHTWSKFLCGKLFFLFLCAPVSAVEVNFSGQVNRMVGVYNNGHRSITHFMDNSNAGSRVGLDGLQQLDNGIVVGVVMQLQLDSNRSDQVNITTRESVGVDDIRLRRSEVWFAKKGWGKIFLGKGSGAANGITEMDLSGTEVIAYARGHVGTMAEIEFYGADFNDDGFIEDEDEEIADQQFQINNVSRFIDNFDTNFNYGERILYKLPHLGPFELSASFGQGDSWELAVRLAQRIYSSKLAVGFGTFSSGVLAEELDSRFDYQFDFQGYGGSVSWLSSFGLSLTAAYSFLKNKENSIGIKPVDGEHIYGKIGYRFGKHAFSVDMAVGNSGYFAEDTDFADTEVASYAAAYVYNLTDGVKIYGSYRNTELTGIANTVEGHDNVGDINAWFIGSLVKF